MSIPAVTLALEAGYDSIGDGWRGMFLETAYLHIHFICNALANARLILFYNMVLNGQIRGLFDPTSTGSRLTKRTQVYSWATQPV